MAAVLEVDFQGESRLHMAGVGEGVGLALPHPRQPDGR